jgi:hypothetical protein
VCLRFVSQSDDREIFMGGQGDVSLHLAMPAFTVFWWETEIRSGAYPTKAALSWHVNSAFS